MFRHGSWVKFDASEDLKVEVQEKAKAENGKSVTRTRTVPVEVAEAHKAADGKLVGIYQVGGVDITGEKYPDAVVVVDGDGFNIRRLSKGEVILVQFNPLHLKGLESVVDRADIPAARLAGNPDWQPKEHGKLEANKPKAKMAVETEVNKE